MEDINLWPDFKLNRTRQPKTILKEQADLLLFQTNNYLYGDVTTLKSGDVIIHKFTIVAPSLGNYRFQLLVVLHNAFSYPCTLTSHFDPIEYNIKDENELIKHLKVIFSDPSTIKIIESLMTQSAAE